MDRKSFEFVCATSVEPFPSPFNGSFRPLTSNCLLDLSWFTDIYSIASCPIPKPACKDVIFNTHGKPPDTPSQLEVFMHRGSLWISMDLLHFITLQSRWFFRGQLPLSLGVAFVSNADRNCEADVNLYRSASTVDCLQWHEAICIHVAVMAARGTVQPCEMIWNALHVGFWWLGLAGALEKVWLAASTIKSDSLIIFGTPECSKQTHWHNPNCHLKAIYIYRL